MLMARVGLVWSSVASADVLFSPPLVAEGENVLDCYLVNVSPGRRYVTIEVLNRAGKVVEKVTTRLGPGEEDVARAASGKLPRFCKFTAGERARLSWLGARPRRRGRRHQRAAGILASRMDLAARPFARAFGVSKGAPAFLAPTGLRPD